MVVLVVMMRLWERLRERPRMRDVRALRKESEAEGEWAGERWLEEFEFWEFRVSVRTGRGMVWFGVVIVVGLY